MNEQYSDTSSNQKYILMSLLSIFVLGQYSLSVN